MQHLLTAEIFEVELESQPYPVIMNRKERGFNIKLQPVPPHKFNTNISDMVEKEITEKIYEKSPTYI